MNPDNPLEPNPSRPPLIRGGANLTLPLKRGKQAIRVADARTRGSWRGFEPNQQSGIKTRDLRLIRYTLAAVWLATGLLSLGIYPQQESLRLLEQVGLYGNIALLALYGSASLDIVLGVLTQTRPSRRLWQAQAALVLGYSAIIACCLPTYWLHPFGPVLKNLPILMLLWLLHEYEEKKSWTPTC